MKVLLDTCVLSELRRPKPHPRVRKTIQEFAAEDLFVSVLSLGEIAKGIARLRDKDRKRDLESWLRLIERHYAERVIGIDLETAHAWAELTAAAQNTGRVVPVIDGLIAATARRHGLHVMTRNVEDFEPTGVLLVNPWASAQ